MTQEEINKRVDLAVNKIIQDIKEDLSKYEPHYSYKTYEPDREGIKKHLINFLQKVLPN
jgi:actin-like ATPase involved in cell morphogenesis